MLALILASLLLQLVSGSVTVYTDDNFYFFNNPLFQTTSPTRPLPAFPTYTKAAAFDNTTLISPPPPSPPIAPRISIQLPLEGPADLSILQNGAFVGFSVELSVANQVFGSNGAQIDPTFLNLLANVKARAGYSTIRIGGNTQEKAVFFPDGLPNNATIIKTEDDLNNPTHTPTIQVSIDLLFAMANISSLVNAHWYVGLPFDNVTQPRLQIAEASEQILGQYLLGFQLANEPDLYGVHGLRQSDYQPSDFINDYRVMIQAIQQNPNIKNKSNLIGPSVCCIWTPEDVFNAGFLDDFADSLAYVAVEHYADTRCPDANGASKAPQDALSEYLDHTIARQGITAAYINTSNISLAHGKPLIMMETNTASCGGFPGISDSFGAGLWGIDWALQMAYANFSGAMMHLGGQNVYYNPFTPPPGSLAAKAGWTVGPMYYVSLIVSEALGSSNKSRVVDLFKDDPNFVFTPAYAIYEDNIPTKVALINFIEDPTGANNYTADITVNGSTTEQVMVKYFTAPSVTTIGNLRWANQTFGSFLESNGILDGKEEIITIPCDTTNNTCSVPVPAPGFALVFLTEAALLSSSPNPSSVQSFSTTVTTASGRNTATIDFDVLVTSNGYGGLNRMIGSTSYDSDFNGASIVGFPDRMYLAMMGALWFTLDFLLM